MKKILISFVFGLYAALAWADLPITVVASFSILGDIVRNVGQDRVKVVEIVGAEKDVHAFQPSPADVKKFAGARLVLMNGLGLEGWIPRMVSASGYRNKVVRVGERLPSLLKNNESHHHGHEPAVYDPHVWQDPVLMKKYVQHIATALSLVDPAGKTVYEANAKAYNIKLEAVHTWAEKMLAEIPIVKRRVITSHSAFSYLGQRYKIEFLSPQGSSTEAEASAKEVAKLVKQIRHTGVRALFIENTSNPGLMETLAREAKVQVGGKLYSDALAKAGPADTYLGMFRHNINTLCAGLKQN